MSCSSLLPSRANDQIVFDGYSVYIDKKGDLAGLGKGFEEDEMIVDIDQETTSCPLIYDPWEVCMRL